VSTQKTQLQVLDNLFHFSIVIRRGRNCLFPGQISEASELLQLINISAFCSLQKNCKKLVVVHINSRVAYFLCRGPRYTRQLLKMIERN